MLYLKPWLPSKWAPSSGFFWLAQSWETEDSYKLSFIKRWEEKEHSLVCFLISRALVGGDLWVISIRMAHSCTCGTLFLKTHQLSLSHFALRTASHGIPCSEAQLGLWLPRNSCFCLPRAVKPSTAQCGTGQQQFDKTVKPQAEWKG